MLDTKEGSDISKLNKNKYLIYLYSMLCYAGILTVENSDIFAADQVFS